ncbi:MAG: hypothetical protein GY869_30240 [Planctomycetes bacterium]|nr:hypothetical protein [Planctomycetota bacterium]
MEKTSNLISRSNLSVLSYQIESLCVALRVVVPHGLRPGKDTITLINHIKKEITSVSSGGYFESIPDASIDSEPADILIIAETLRGTLMSFLTSEEIEEQNRTFGFHSNK